MCKLGQQRIAHSYLKQDFIKANNFNDSTIILLMHFCWNFGYYHFWVLLHLICNVFFWAVFKLKLLLFFLSELSPLRFTSSCFGLFSLKSVLLYLNIWWYYAKKICKVITNYRSFSFFFNKKKMIELKLKNFLEKRISILL